MGKKATVESVLAAIPNSEGFAGLVGERVGVNRKTINSYMKETPEIAEAMKVERARYAKIKKAKSVKRSVYIPFQICANEYCPRGDKKQRETNFYLTTNGLRSAYCKLCSAQFTGFANKEGRDEYGFTEDELFEGCTAKQIAEMKALMEKK